MIPSRISLLFLVLSLFAFAGSTQGQSTDQSNPTPVSSNELTITGPKKNNQQYYYSFTGGPGEVSLTLSVKAKSSSTFVGIKVFDAELNTLTFHNMSADTSSPGMAKKKFDVGDRQTLVMSFTSDASLGECKIKFEGAVEMGAGTGTGAGDSMMESAPSTASDMMSSSSLQATPPPVASAIDPSGATKNNSAGKNKIFTMSILDAVGQRFNIPANGKLRIEMKDGSVQEIDLTQVKKILVKN